MNEKNNNIVVVILSIIIAIAFCGIIYYYGSSSKKLENELVKLERINNELASQTIQLRNELEGHQQRITSITTGITDVSKEIGTVTNRIGKSQQGVRDIYTQIKQSGTDLKRAESIIIECEEILQKITKTK